MGLKGARGSGGTVRAREGADGAEVDRRGGIREKTRSEDGWRIDKLFKLFQQETSWRRKKKKKRNFKFLE